MCMYQSKNVIDVYLFVVYVYYSVLLSCVKDIKSFCEQYMYICNFYMCVIYCLLFPLVSSELSV